MLLPLIDTPLVEIFQAVREQRLGALKVRLNSRHVVTIVLAAAGYPGTPETGVPIEGLESNLPDTAVFHAVHEPAMGGRSLPNGGRVPERHRSRFGVDPATRPSWPTSARQKSILREVSIGAILPLA